MKFEVTDEDQAKISEWLKTEVYPEIVEAQREEYKDNPAILSMLEGGYPYTGAIGGGLEYIFTPTSIGLAFHVRYYNGKELNLTNYDLW